MRIKAVTKAVLFALAEMRFGPQARYHLLFMHPALGPVVTR